MSHRPSEVLNGTAHRDGRLFNAQWLFDPIEGGIAGFDDVIGRIPRQTAFDEGEILSARQEYKDGLLHRLDRGSVLVSALLNC